MPKKYLRKFGILPRAQRMEKQLLEAGNRIPNEDIGKREAERYYNIPARTLDRGMKSGKLTRLGPSGTMISSLCHTSRS
ncbi:hypothetical protein PR048_023721 [Dryococelus australis]|uniref:Uncharacterized protein n=1 Tax=Dryococelus australis TaxID=614101 RepID=A0ABQ9GUW4_9NEOP|nr:hypothetical protein PR048_023721 [Dryococelus australis]